LPVGPGSRILKIFESSAGSLIFSGDLLAFGNELRRGDPGISSPDSGGRKLSRDGFLIKFRKLPPFEEASLRENEEDDKRWNGY